MGSDQSINGMKKQEKNDGVVVDSNDDNNELKIDGKEILEILEINEDYQNENTTDADEIKATDNDEKCADNIVKDKETNDVQIEKKSDKTEDVVRIGNMYFSEDEDDDSEESESDEGENEGDEGENEGDEGENEGNEGDEGENEENEGDEGEDEGNEGEKDGDINEDENYDENYEDDENYDENYEDDENYNENYDNYDDNHDVELEENENIKSVLYHIERITKKITAYTTRCRKCNRENLSITLPYDKICGYHNERNAMIILKIDKICMDEKIKLNSKNMINSFSIYLNLVKNKNTREKLKEEFRSYLIDVKYNLRIHLEELTEFYNTNHHFKDSNECTFCGHQINTEYHSSYDINWNDIDEFVMLQIQEIKDNEFEYDLFI